MGDQETVERVVKRIMSAKRPLILGGDGVNYSEGEKEFVEFVELAGVPACGRRSGRGCIPEVHPQNVRLEPYTPDADLIVLVGAKITIFDGSFGAGWPSSIQINEAPQHIWPSINSEEVVIGSPKGVLRQMINIIKRDNLQPNPEAREWLKRLQERERAGWGRLMERAEKYKNNKPIHHAWLARVAYEVMEDLYGGMNRIYLDGLSMSSFAPAFYKARYPSAVMDAAEHAGVGHSIGQCIGAFFADPEKAKAPGVMWLGDAGFGLAAFDLETMCRYDVPGVAIINNNGGWQTGIERTIYGKGWAAKGPQDRPYGEGFLPGIRYENMDKVFPWMQGFYVEDPDQLRPTLEKAFRAAEKGGAHGKGGPALVHVPIEPSMVTAGEMNFFNLLLYGHLPFAKVSKRMKMARRYYLGQPGPANMQWFDFDKWGFPEISPEDLPDSWDPTPDDMATP
jgi:thiamine pyrophosphate-dependent acetolactate synthase large subunit-like protein